MIQRKRAASPQKRRLIDSIRRLGRGSAKADAGWTFMETLIVLGIILILTATVAFMAIRYLGKAKVVAVRSQIDALELALQAYYLDCGYFPTQEQGLAALWEKPTLSPVPDAWGGPYMAKQLPRDPWGRDFVYRLPGPNSQMYGIASYGADGIEGGEGEALDITSW
ncbi:MAG TPA: type II secretion system protein GspG [Spirochaetaceae bacterium]|nr:type II secretion system protein GspG [Spirochaetaceae bacterium]HAW85484.1 type II secretion system protein GspG [Spirochaetaceae bacterium]HAX37574.1 type II secretion system protein GspG [Spirochaetaceae bacterium]HBO42195.1 type II secretion system protein GspG [Spirochaetaceae bacterium]HCQ86140.1 type II secretion system protein GspG [Spirochaetaceae bacterium]